MAAEVETPSGAKLKHQDAEAIDVRDGHVFLSRYQNAAWEPVAIYAPGRWVAAKLLP